MRQNNILEWLEKQKDCNPKEIALGDINRDIPYYELWDSSRRVASSLLQFYGNIISVAIIMPKDISAVMAMYGVVYAGAFYSNIDLNLPKERLNQIIQELNPSVIITYDEKVEELSSLVEETYEITTIKELLVSEVDDLLLEKVRRKHIDTDPLYCNFTSGSTGIPKGVLINHRSVIDFISTFVETFSFYEDDIFANQAPLDFDVSVKDIYSAVAIGAKVQLIPREYFSYPVKLMDYLSEKKVTILIWAVSAMCFVSTMKGFLYKIPDRVRYVMFSGEIMPMKHLRIWKEYLPEVQYVNLYGPTEITCNCTYHILHSSDFDKEIIPIGRPFHNEKVFLLNSQNVEVATAGEVGEICVGGTCLAVGYMNSLDNSSFVQNPINKQYYERIYRTGDLGYWNENDELVYCGRKDNQIKHMGHRIELEEIERICEQMESEKVIRSCCLYDSLKSKIFLFYHGEANETDVKDWLVKKLPFFMLPNKIIKLLDFKLSKNGKIDRKYLKEEYMR